MKLSRALRFLRKINSKSGLSKFVDTTNLGPKSDHGFLGSGWRGGGQLIWKDFVQNRIKVNQGHQPLRGFKGSTSDKPILTSLQDPGKMNGITDLFFKPAIFSALVTSGSFVGCTIWQYENQRKLQRTGSYTLTNSMGGESRRASPGGRDKRFESRNSIHLWWEKATPGEKIFWSICGLNCLVFAAWHMPGLAPRMVTYFTATPVARAVCWPMILSTFSHYSLFHLGANMFVLHSFMPAAVSLLGPEQFVSTYVSAGVLSSFGSHVCKLLMGNNVPSLGASGAVMGILAYVCMKMPDIQLGIIFIPGLTFTADTAIKCILAVDTVGLIAGWRIMDHAAHLSGALYGIGIYYFESSVVEGRDKIMRFWHSLRSAK